MMKHLYKSILSISFLSITTLAINAQPTQQWFQSYNGSFSGADVVNDMMVDNSGNVYVCGSTDTFGAASDYIVLKYGNDGTLIWKYTYNGPASAEDIATAIALDDSGHVYVTGRSKGIGTQFDYATLKLHGNSGLLLWEERYNNISQNLDDAAIDLDVKAGSIVVAGYSINKAHSSSGRDYYLICYDQSGNDFWDYTQGSHDDDLPAGVYIGSSGIVWTYGNYDGEIWSVLGNQLSNGSFHAHYNPSLGSFSVRGGPSDLVDDGSGYLYAIGKQGIGSNSDFSLIGEDVNFSYPTPDWGTNYNLGSNRPAQGNAIALSSNGTIWATGQTDIHPSLGVEDLDVVTLKYNSTGSILDTVYYSSSANRNEIGVDIVVDKFMNPNVYVLGRSEDSQSNQELLVLKYNSNLLQQWEYRKGCPNGHYEPLEMHLDDFDNLTIAGYYTCNGTQEDIFVMRLCTSLPTAEAGQNETICEGESVQLNGTGSGGFSWSPVAGLNDPSIANPVATPAQTTTYYLTVAYGGCEAVDSVTITVLPKPNASSSPDVAICQGNTTQLSASGGISYQWSPSSTLDNPVLQSPTAQPTLTTKYTVTVTDANGCQDTASTEVTVHDLPVVNAGPDVSVCVNESIQLQASGGTVYSWQPATGLSDPNIANPVASPPGTLIYTVTVTDANGCQNQNNIKVTVNPLPTANAGNDRTICSGDTTVLQATGGVVYAWSPATGLSSTSIGSPSASPAFTTIYSVTVTDANGCKDQDEVQVTVNALPTANAGPDIAICFGDNTQLMGTGGESYGWSPATGLNNPTIYNPVATPSTTRTYTLTVEDSNGCRNTDQVTVSVNPEFASAGSDVEICLGDSVQLEAIGGVTYAWQPMADLSDATVPNPWAFPPSTTTYTVTITDANNCNKPEQVTVTVDSIPAKPTISLQGSDLVSSAPTGNQWYKNNDTIPGETGQTYTPSDSAYYWVRVTDGNGCSNRSDSLFWVPPVGIQSTFTNYAVRVMPNPTDGPVKVSFKKPGKYELYLYNATGNFLLKRSIEIDQPTDKIHFDLSAFPKGFYLLYIQNNIAHHTAQIILQ